MSAQIRFNEVYDLLDRLGGDEGGATLTANIRGQVRSRIPYSTTLLMTVADPTGSTYARATKAFMSENEWEFVNQIRIGDWVTLGGEYVQKGFEPEFQITDVIEQ